jgi:hypothetical protein
MSRHTPRKERWTRINAKEYRALFGVVRYLKGAWEGPVHHELLPEEVEACWRAEATFAGRYKRPRNAMMGVEEKAREILRRHRERVKIAFED